MKCSAITHRGFTRLAHQVKAEDKPTIDELVDMMDSTLEDWADEVLANWDYSSER